MPLYFPRGGSRTKHLQSSRKTSQYNLGHPRAPWFSGEACLLCEPLILVLESLPGDSWVKPSLDPFLKTEVRGLEDTLLNSCLGWIWACPLEVLPTTETFCQCAQLLPLSCHTMRASLLCPFNQNALLCFWALPSDAEDNFFPNLVNKSVWPASHLRKRLFYVPRPSTGLPPVSRLQLGKNLVPQKQTINPSQVLQAEVLKHEIWLQLSISKTLGTHWNQYRSSCSP